MPPNPGSRNPSTEAMNSVNRILLHIPAGLLLVTLLTGSELSEPGQVIASPLRPVVRRGAQGRHDEGHRFAARPQLKSPADQAKEVARTEFARNFSDLQNTGYALLREHEARQLDPQRLTRDARKINRHARNLRGMIALGELEKPVQEKREPLAAPHQFDQSIRRLVRLIYTFAHNPIHQNRRVFDTSKAQQALTDLETIIILSKALEAQARSYRPE